MSYLSLDLLLNKAFVLGRSYRLLYLNSPYLSYVYCARVWINNYLLPSARFMSFFSSNNYTTTWWKINQLTDLPEASILYLGIVFIVDFLFKQN
jgi:hypothetical protein